MKSRFVLDCSVAAAWRLDDENCEYVESVFHSLKYNIAIVPALWHIELSNVLSCAKRRNRVSESQILSFLHMLDSLPIETSSLDITKRELISLSQEHDLTTYDACYFSIAMTYNLPLATLDKKLSQALLDAGGKIYEPKILSL